MSSTEDDEPPPKKARPEAKAAKMVAPPGEWKDFLELEEYPQPAGHVRACPCPPMPDVTPPQDAKFKIDLKDLLRPYHSYKDDVLPLGPGVHVFPKTIHPKVQGQTGQQEGGGN